MLAPVVEDFQGYAERNDELAQALMRRHGDPATEVVTALARGVARVPRLGRQRARRRTSCTTAASWSSPSARFEVLHRPGHSPSDTVFFDAGDRATLIAGDHLIAHISSNPLIALPLGGRSGEPGGERRTRC